MERRECVYSRGGWCLVHAGFCSECLCVRSDCTRWVPPWQQLETPDCFTPLNNNVILNPFPWGIDYRDLGVYLPFNENHDWSCIPYPWPIHISFDYLNIQNSMTFCLEWSDTWISIISKRKSSRFTRLFFFKCLLIPDLNGLDLNVALV